MNSVEKKYYQAMQEMSGIDKMNRIGALYRFTYQMMENKIKNKFGNKTELEKRILIAQHMYFSDKQAMALLEKWKQHLGIQI